MYHRYLLYEEKETKMQLEEYRRKLCARGVHKIGHNLKYFLFENQLTKFSGV